MSRALRGADQFWRRGTILSNLIWYQTRDTSTGAAQKDVPDSPHARYQVSCYVPRLWHQLTLAIFDFLDHPDSPPYQLDLFEHFVSDFQNKLDKLRLAQIGTKVSKQIPREYSVPLLICEGVEYLTRETFCVALYLNLNSRLNVSANLSYLVEGSDTR